MTKKIKKPAPYAGKKIQANEEPAVLANIQHPVFCFKYLHKDYCLDQCDKEDKVKLIEKLVQLSKMSWINVQQAGRHGLGTEKIATNSLKVLPPKEITDDVSFLAFRFHGKKPVVGFKTRFVFHLVFIDRDFSVYNH